MAGGSYIELPIDPISRGSNCINLNADHKGEGRINGNERLFPDIGGGFSYSDQSKITKHRQIIWKVIDNVIKLEEHSLDHNLFGNKLDIRINNEVLIPNVVIEEREKELLLFFATTESIHQLILVHPNHEKYGFIVPSGVHVSFPSVFNNALESYKHRMATLPQSCNGFDVITTSNGDVYFGLATDSKTLLISNLAASQESSFMELKDASMMQRLWTGLVPSFVRGDQSSWMGVESVVMHSFGSSDEIFAFTLCADLKIRVWSVKKQSCIATKDLASLIPRRDDSQPEMVCALSLKKANVTSNRQLIMAAHCCFANSSKIIVLEVFKEQKDIVIMHVSDFHSTYNSVQDVCLTTHFIYVLWNKSDGDHSISYAPIEGGKEFEKGWHPVHMKQADKEDLLIPVYQDAKEIYLERIFRPGNFNKEAVLKALKVFTKTLDIDANCIPDISSDVSSIKEGIIQVLEMEIERNVIARDLHPSDYQELQHQCWSKYFSFVQQCYQAREKPLGLYTSESDDLVMVIRQETCGYLHSTDWIDHLYLTDLDDCEDVTSYIENELDITDETVSNDILIIIKCLKTIPLQFNNDVILGIDNDLDRNEDLKTFLNSMAASLITNSRDFEQLVGDPVQRGSYLYQLEDRLKHSRNPQKAVDFIINALQSTEFHSTSMSDQSDTLIPHLEGNSQFLCGQNGIELLTELLKQTTYNRMHLCRDLYVMLKIMDKLGLSQLFTTDFGLIASGVCYELLRSYHAVYWSAKTNFTKLDISTVDTNLNHLAALHLTERSQSSSIDLVDDSPVSLLTSFIRSGGIKNSLGYLTESNLNSMKPGDYSMPEMIKLVARALLNDVWVLNENSSSFPEYLASQCQYCALMNYLHFCDEWCSYGRSAKDFLLAQSYLGSDEPQKALKYFIDAAKGIILKQPFLMNIIDGGTERREESLVLYFVKVMRLYEQFEYPTFVITVASSALTIASKYDSNVPMLWSVVFKYHLELEHYNEAYASIVHNTDNTRRYHCLRRFIVTLCDAGLFQEICSYEYINMEDEVVSIIEKRARTTDITVNKYYDLLYSYHIMKDDYRKAATTMYEHACRLKTEMHGLQSLQKQAKCYLASMTALKLVKAQDAWIIRPNDKVNVVENKQPSQKPYSQSPKRREDGEEIYYSSTKKQKTNKTVIIEMDDLEKEYLLIFSRLKMVQIKKHESVAIGPNLTATETIGLLAQAGLFDNAFSLALKFKLSLTSIFEVLAGKCAMLVNFKPSELDERWKWLTFNEVNSNQLVTAKSATDQAFYLLQNYLKRFKENKSSAYYKAVASKFLSMGCSLPSWLVQDYEKTNPAELLHVYLSYDMTTEATQLSLSYIDGVLGNGKENLGLNTALHATTPPVWLPYTSFDLLLTALRANFENPDIAELCEDLQDKLEDYFMKLEVVSCDKLNYLHSVKTSEMIA